MIRFLACLSLVSCAFAAETDLAAAATAARGTAETELATVRAALTAERTALAKAMHEAHAEADAARVRLKTAVAARDEAQAELSLRRKEQERELVLVRQQADKAVVAARLGDAEAKEVAKLPPAERVAKATPAFQARLDRLPKLLTAQRGDERIIARDGAMVQAPVLRLGEARAVALGADDATRGVLVRAADGSSWRVSGPPIAVDPSRIAIDISGGLGQHTGHRNRSIGEWIAAGRFFIWPILGSLLIGLGIAAWRFLSLPSQAVDPQLTARVTGAVLAGDVAGARALVAAGRTPLARILDAGLAVLDRGRDAREAALAQALLAEQPRLNQGLAFLMVLAGIAPLLGLLGTVTGMIDMFTVLADQGSGNAKSLSGAISEALTTTQAGMIVAIPLLLLHAILARIAERRLLRMEEAAIGLIGLGGER